MSQIAPIGAAPRNDTLNHMNKLKIIYEDDHLIAADKPAGQMVIPGRGETEGEPLVHQVTHHLGKKAYVVHRIDRETSGLVVFAKDAPTHKTLSTLWEERGVKKTYLAWVRGKPHSKEGLLNYPLKAFGSGRMGVGPGGKSSQTRYCIQKTDGNASLLEVEPLTGRRHQIRVHLYHMGYPILGDPLYGQDRPVGGYPRLMLHALKLDLPLSNGPLSLKTELPADFKIS